MDGGEAGVGRIAKFAPKRVHAFMDSELVCKQLNGIYRVKHPDLQPLYRQVVELATSYNITMSTCIGEDKLADAQVNLAIDRALALNVEKMQYNLVIMACQTRR